MDGIGNENVTNSAIGGDSGLATSSSGLPVKRSKREERPRSSPEIKKHLTELHRKVLDSPWSEFFRKPVPANVVGYHEAVFQKFDLHTIKKDIDNGNITTVNTLLHRLYRMLANGIMYNGYDTDVSKHAKWLIDTVITKLTQSDEQSVAEPVPAEDNSRTDSMDPEPINEPGEGEAKRAVPRISVQVCVSDDSKSINTIEEFWMKQLAYDMSKQGREMKVLESNVDNFSLHAVGTKRKFQVVEEQEEE